MRTLLLLVLIALAGAWFYPPYAEEAPNICSAFEKRMARLVQAEATRVLPQGRTNDPRVNALLDTMKTVVAGANGAIAQAYVKDKFPQMPAEVGCDLAFWKITFDPDLTQYMKGKIGITK